MRCELCPLYPVDYEEVCPEAEGEEVQFNFCPVCGRMIEEENDESLP